MQPIQAYSVTTRSWWTTRRLHYNLGLAAAGIIACVIYLVVFSVFHDVFRGSTALREILLGGFLYFLFMGFANICYFIGPLSEWIVKPANPLAYRRIAYGLGFWLSCAVPFIMPLVNILIFLHQRGNQ